MVVNKKSFILYTDIYESVKNLSLKEKGKLFDAIFNMFDDKSIVPSIERKLILFLVVIFIPYIVPVILLTTMLLMFQSLSI